MGELVASKNLQTGMLGVYLVAAELSRRGFTVSPTSRSARGADLLVTDQECQRAYSVQVKTNAKPASFWLLNAKTDQTRSPSHIYVFVNIRGDQRPEYYVVPSRVVAERMRVFTAATGAKFYEFRKTAVPEFEERWKVFGRPTSA